MPLKLIDNQAVVLDSLARNCRSCGESCFCEKYNGFSNDKLFWQAKQTPCRELPLCPDYTFGTEMGENPILQIADCADWTVPAGWTCTAEDGICHTPGSTNILSESLSSATIAGKLYKVTLNIQSITAGVVTVGFAGGETVAIASNVSNVDFFLMSIGSVSELQFTPSSDFNGCVFAASISQVTNFGWTLGYGYTYAGPCKFCHANSDTPDNLTTIGLGLTIGGYYQLKYIITGDASARVHIGLELMSVGTGEFTVYITPTGSGISISLSGNSCIQFVELNELKNDVEAALIDIDTGVLTDISKFITYYKDWITISASWNDFGLPLKPPFEIPDGCFRLAIYNTCCICTKMPAPCRTVCGPLPPSPLGYISGCYYYDNSSPVIYYYNGEVLTVVPCPGNVITLHTCTPCGDCPQPPNPANLVINGTFNSDLSSWTVSPLGSTVWDGASHSAHLNPAGLPVAIHLTQDITLINCHNYKLTYDLAGFVDHSGDGSGYIRLTPFEIPRTADGSYEFDFTFSGSFSPLSIDAVAAEAYIDNIKLVDMGCDVVCVDTCLQWNIGLNEWVPCPKDGVGCNILCNGNFMIQWHPPAVKGPDPCWTMDNLGLDNQSLGGGTWSLKFPKNTIAAGVISEPVSLCRCRRYEVSFDYRSNLDFGYTFHILGSCFSTVRGDGVSAGSGTVTFSFGTSASLDTPWCDDFILSLMIAAMGSSSGGSIAISNFLMQALPVGVCNDSPETCDCPEYLSNCLCFKWINECAQVTQGYCDNPAFGFEFINSGFRLQQRLQFSLIASRHKEDSSDYIYSMDKRELGYAYAEKFVTAFFESIPQYALDCLEYTRLCKHFFLGELINNQDILTEYFRYPQDFQPEWPKNMPMNEAPVRFEVRKKLGPGFSTNCDS